MDEKSNLDLNTDSIMERIGVRSSLTDINQISVFSDEFESRIEEFELEKEQEQQALNTKVFAKELLFAADMDIIDQLFVADEEVLIIRNEKENAENQILSPVTSTLLVIIIFAFGVIYMLGMKGNRRNDVNNQPEASGRR